MQKIFSVPQIQAWDTYTIDNEPISSLDLMERAATCFWEAAKKLIALENDICVLCGNGNNGGDGKVVARLAYQAGYKVQVLNVADTGKMSKESEINETKLPPQIPIFVYNESTSLLPQLGENTVVIDGIFGSGLTREADIPIAKLIHYINQHAGKIIAIDVPSGLFCDKHSEGKDIIKADFTFTFQAPKLAFFLPENAQFVGKWRVLDIGLSTKYQENTATKQFYLNEESCSILFPQRAKFSHKGTYGHALLMAGSKGKVGAAILAAKACLHSGVGLLSCFVPACAYTIMQTSVPEAMCIVADNEEMLIPISSDLSFYNAFIIGPGIGQSEETKALILQIFTQKTEKQALIMDADALNLLAKYTDLLEKLPPNAILTPHPKEFERLIGSTKDDFDRLEKGKAFAEKYQIFLLLKGAHSVIFTPQGELFFNTTGNPGMAKGGSGDILSGIIGAWLAQGLPPFSALCLSVFAHGKAGDFAANAKGQTSMIASDIIESLSSIWRRWELI